MNNTRQFRIPAPRTQAAAAVLPSPALFVEEEDFFSRKRDALKDRVMGRLRRFYRIQMERFGGSREF